MDYTNMPKEKLAEKYREYSSEEKYFKAEKKKISEVLVGWVKDKAVSALDHEGFRFTVVQKITPSFKEGELISFLKSRGVWDRVKKEVLDQDKLEALVLEDQELAKELPQFVQEKKASPYIKISELKGEGANGSSDKGKEAAATGFRI